MTVADTRLSPRVLETSHFQGRVRLGELVTGRCLVVESHIAASPECVFAFHERPDAFALLTPWWSGERVRLILGGGSLSVEWEGVREIYEPPTCFVERQVRGSFRRWSHRHRHLVRPDGVEARLRDELEYELPGSSLAPLLDLVLRPFLGRMFGYRRAVMRRPVSAGPLVRSASA